MSRINIVELRQYTLRGGRRDELIHLFEREFIASQDAVGARILGTFRDLDDSDRFVWLRGFESMESRAKALNDFYSGPVWRAHGKAANATMVDSDNVLLLRSADRDPELATTLSGPWRVSDIMTANIHYVGGAEPEAFAAFFETALRPRLKEIGAPPIATLISEESPNSFPRLPVREREPVFVWFARHESLAAERQTAARLAQLTGWRDAAPANLLPALARKPELLRLVPASNSALR